MQRSFLYSLLLHIVIILGLLINFQNLKKTKKLSYQKFAINIAVKQKNSTKDQKTAAPQIKEVKQPTTSQKSENVEVSKEKKIEKVEEKKLEAERLKQKKESDAKKTQKTETKKEVKKSAEPITKRIKKEKKFPTPVKGKKQKDIFSKLFDHKGNDSENIGKKVAHLADHDIAIIREQISRYWIKTPCPDDVNIELEIVVNSGCDIISRNIDIQKYACSPQIMACANSAFRATQQCKKLDLDAKKCQKLNNKLIILNFNTVRQ